MRILIIDDHPMCIQGLRILLFQVNDAAQCVIAGNLRCALAMTGPFDLLFLDFHLPDTQGMDGLLQIKNKFAATPVIVISGEDNDTLTEQIMAHGAADFISKRTSPNDLIEKIKKILQGETCFPSQKLDLAADTKNTAVAKQTRQKCLSDLGFTQRQSEVFSLLAQGKSNKLIARELGLAEPTVKKHIDAVFRVLHVKSRTQALCKATQLGFAVS